MASIAFSSTVPLEYTENSDAVFLDSAALLDSTGFESLENGELRVSFGAGGLPSDRLAVGANPSAGISLDGRAVRQGGIEIATVSGGIGTQPLVIRFNSAAQFSGAQAVLRSLNYVNLSEALPPSAERRIDLELLLPGQSIPAIRASRGLSVIGVDDAPVVYNSQRLYNNPSVQLTDQAAAPGGPWLAYQDTITYPSGIPVVGGRPFLGGSATRAANEGTVLTTDAQAYAGFSNYRANYAQLANLATQPSATVTLELVNNAFPVLERQAGFQLSFSAQLLAEGRTAAADRTGDGVGDRAGFSVLVVSSDLKAIELGFWQDEIWAQNDGTTQLNPSLEPDTSPANPLRTLFTHGEGISFDTSQARTYGLAVQGDRYQLFADDALILSGALRDYTAFSVPPTLVQLPIVGNKTINLPDPYETPNLIFLGDNTPAASASVKLSNITLRKPNIEAVIAIADGIATVPQLYIGDADGLDQIVSVRLSVPSGRFAIAGNDPVSVTQTNRGPILTGTLAAINALLDDAQRFVYQPAPEAKGLVPITVEFGPFLPEPRRQKSDFNGDGFSDLVLRNDVSGDNLARFLTAGLETLGDAELGRKIPDKDWRIDALGDFSGDGQADLVLRNYHGSGEILLWTMNGTSIASEELLGRLVPDPAWEVAGTGDFDGDGKTDLLLKNYVSDDTLVWFMDGTQIRSEALIGRTLGDPSWRISGTGDFNGDGQTDILLRHQSPTGLGQNIAWLMNGSQIEQEVLIGREVADPDWEIAGVADFGSGQSDVLLRNYRTGDNLVWLMNGTSIAQELPILPVADTNWRIVV